MLLYAFLSVFCLSDSCISFCNLILPVLTVFRQVLSGSFEFRSNWLAPETSSCPVLSLLLAFRIFFRVTDCSMRQDGTCGAVPSTRTEWTRQSVAICRQYFAFLVFFSPKLLLKFSPWSLWNDLHFSAFFALVAPSLLEIYLPYPFLLDVLRT